MARQRPVSFLDHFASLPDPRVKRTRRHELLDIIAIALCAVISGAESWDDVADYGRSKRDWLATFLSDSAIRVSAIRTAAGNNDTARLELELHSLSGAAGTMGLPALVASCEQLRKAAGQGMKPLPEYLVDRIDSALRDAREALLSSALAA